jgi:hypothetical protein
MDIRASGPTVLLSSIEHKMDCLEYFDDLSGSPDQCCKYGMIFFRSRSGSDFSDGFGFGSYMKLYKYFKYKFCLYILVLLLCRIAYYDELKAFKEKNF